MELFTAVTSLTAAIAAVYGAIQKQRIEKLSLDLENSNDKLNKAKNELYNVYLNVRELLHIETELASQLKKGKITVRRGHKTTRHIQPKHVETRIKELKFEIQLDKE